MTTRRVERLRDLIREHLSELIIYKIKDPRLASVSITGVRLGGDLKKAVATFSIYQGALTPEEATVLLNKAAGFFRREIGSRLDLRHTPEISFLYDRNLAYAQHISQVLTRLETPPATPEDPESPDAPSPPDADQV